MSGFFGSIGRWLNKYKSVFALSFAGLLLLFAQSAFWVNQTIFDKKTFTGIATGVIQSEESREAIASGIVDKALADRPVLQRTISGKATQLLTGLLGTDAVVQATNLIVDKAYTYATSNEPEAIAFDLTAIKTPVARIIAFAEDQGREVAFDPATIPDSITLFDPADLPDIYKYSVVMLWLGPLLWLSTLAIFGIYIYKGGKKFYGKRVYVVGAVIGVVGIVGLMVGPLLPPTVSALVPQTHLRSIVGDLSAAFLQPFTQQMITMLLVTAIFLAVFSQRFNLLRLAMRVMPTSSPKAAAEAPVKSAKSKTPTKKTKK